jgi:hypothetical protein
MKVKDLKLQLQSLDDDVDILLCINDRAHRAPILKSGDFYWRTNSMNYSVLEDEDCAVRLKLKQKQTLIIQ